MLDKYFRPIRVFDIIKFDELHTPTKTSHARITGYYNLKKRPDLYGRYYEFTRGDIIDGEYRVAPSPSRRIGPTYILALTPLRRKDIKIVQKGLYDK